MNVACFKRGFNAMSGQRLKAWALVGIGMTAAYMLYTFNPASSVLYVPCPFHKLTGFYCPGCGSLRAIHHLLHGDVVIAFRLNPLMVLLLPFLGYSFFVYVMGNIRRRPLPPLVVPAIAIWVFLGVVLLFWAMRNIPTYPFSLLTPSG